MTNLVSRVRPQSLHRERTVAVTIAVRIGQPPPTTEAFPGETWLPLSTSDGVR